MAMNDERRVRCSFCGKHQDQVKRMIAGPGVYICNECVNLCMEAMGAEALLKAMLTPGEYAAYAARVQEVCGFDEVFGELEDQAKN